MAGVVSLWLPSAIEDGVRKLRSSLNFGTVAAITLTEAMINGALNNNKFGPKAGKSGVSLLTSVVSANLISQILKGNVNEPTSVKGQFYVLGAHTATALSADLFAYYSLDEQDRGVFVGQATLISMLINLAFTAKIVSSAILGRSTHRELPSQTGIEKKAELPSHINARKFAVGSLIAAAAASAHLFSLYAPTNGSNLIANMSYSQILRVTEKAGFKVVDLQYHKAIKEKADGEEIDRKHYRNLKLRSVSIDTMTAATSSTVVGAIVPMPTSTATGFLLVAQKITHIVGVAGGTAFGTLLTNTGIRAFELKEPKQKKEKTASQLEAGTEKKTEKEKGIHWGRLAYRTAGSVAVISGGVAAHALNDALSHSANVALIINLCLAGFLFHWTKRAVKDIPNNVAEKIYLLALVAIAAGLEQGVRSQSPGESNDTTFPVFAMTMGNMATFIGKDVRNFILPKAGSSDED